MIYIILLIIVMRINFVYLHGELVVFDTKPKRLNLRNIYKYRCTRRYTPGTCLNEVNPVWTFEFQLQNCTERLGCQHASRSNRFDTYNGCMVKCRRMIALYGKILTYEKVNHTDSLREGPDISSRQELSMPDKPVDYDDQEDHEDESELFNYMYKDFETAGDAKSPINVDYLVRGSHYIGENY